jgi:hypothetical protein
MARRDHLEDLLLGRQKAFGPPPLGDVLHHAFVANDLPVVVVNASSRVPNPKDRAVPSANPKLEALDDAGPLDGLLPTATVLRVKIEVGHGNRLKGLQVGMAEHLDQGRVGVQDPTVRRRAV